MDNLCVEMLGALSIECSIYAQSQNWCKCTLPRMSAMKKRLSHLFIAVVFLNCRWSSYLATTARSECIVSLPNDILATAIQGTFSMAASKDQADHLQKKPLNSNKAWTQYILYELSAQDKGICLRLYSTEFLV